MCISDNYWLGKEKPCITYGLRYRVQLCFFTVLGAPTELVNPWGHLLSLYEESTNYWMPIIHSFGCCAEEGHQLGLSCSKKESESNDILICTMVIEFPTSLNRTFHMKMYKYRSENNWVS